MTTQTRKLPANLKPHSRDHGSEPSPAPIAKSGSAATIRNCLIVIATIAVLWTLQWAKLFFIPLAVAIFLTFWLMPIVDLLQRIRIARILGAAIVVGTTVFAIASAGYTLREDARDFASGLSKAVHHARIVFVQASRDPNGWLHHIRATVTDSTLPIPSANPHPENESAANNSLGLPFSLLRGSSTAATAIINISIVLILTYLMLASGDLFKRKLVVVISGQLSRRRMTVEIMQQIAVQFQRYLAVLATTNLAVGIGTWALFSALDVEHAEVWGVAAGILHVVPYLGPAAIAIASLLVTSLQFNSLSQALLVASTSLLISALVGMLLSTWLASRASHMNSVAVFTGLMFWGWLWGIPGLLLGTPLMMAIKVVADRVACLHWLSTFLDGVPKHERRHPRAELANKSIVSSDLPI